MGQCKALCIRQVIDPNDCLLEPSAPIDEGSEGGMRVVSNDDGTKYEGFITDDLREG